MLFRSVLRYLCIEANSRAVWIDTTGEFTSNRTSTILQRCAGLVRASESSACSISHTEFVQPAAETALGRLEVAVAFDFTAMHEVMDTLQANIIVCVVA